MAYVKVPSKFRSFRFFGRFAVTTWLPAGPVCKSQAKKRWRKKGENKKSKTKKADSRNEAIKLSKIVSCDTDECTENDKID